MSGEAASSGPRTLAGSVGRLLVFGLLFIGFTIAAQGLLAGPIAWLLARTGLHVRMDELMLLAASLAATAVMVRSVDVRPWQDVGLGAGTARLPMVALATALGGGAIGIASVLLLLAGWLEIGPSAPGSSLGAAVAITAFLLPAALYEEVLCRGYLLTALRDSLGSWRAVGITSVLFGLLHLQNVGATVQSVAIVTLAGVFLGAVRMVFDSLYAAWAAHMAWNWVMAVPLHAAVSGQRFASPDYRTVDSGPDWITGGTWGPEGGLAAALGMMAALAYLHTRHRRGTARRGREESGPNG